VTASTAALPSAQDFGCAEMFFGRSWALRWLLDGPERRSKQILPAPRGRRSGTDGVLGQSWGSLRSASDIQQLTSNR
jgi:hypothetical protein